MSTLSDRLRDQGKNPWAKNWEVCLQAADELDRLTARVAEWQRLYRRALNEANGLTNYAEDRPELYSAEKRLPRIDHFAREAFEKFASGVECELTNYRWFEAGWDARGDTVAAAPLPSAPAQSITDYMMDLVDRLGHEAENVDPKAWQHLLVYAPKPSAPDTVQVPDPKPRWFDI